MILKYKFSFSTFPSKFDPQVPIISPEEASILASKYYNQGFETLKLVVGKNLAAEVAAIEAIHAAQPCCSFMFDANERYTADEAIKFLEKLKGNNLPR